MEDQVFSYEETAAAKFPLNSFPWRKVTVRAYAGLPRDTSAAGRKDSSQFAGSFHYRSSSLSSSPCRNRFILWHYNEGLLKLLELSLDINLAGNALVLEMEGAAPLIPNVCVQESKDHSMVVVLFASCSAVYRLVLPHPAHIMKDPGLSAVGIGLVPSVLAFATEQSFIGPNMATIFAEVTSASPVTMATGCIAVNGTTTFALASPAGTIFTVEVPPPGEHGLPVRSQLQESSMMYRLLSSFIPLKGSTESEDAPVSLGLHIFEGQTVIMSLCRDLKLKLWSCQLGQCVMTHSLYDYIQADIDPSIKADKLMLKIAPGGTINSVRFGVHIRIGGHSQISLFQVILIESQLHLQPLQDVYCPENSSLVDFFVTNRELWGMWSYRSSEGEDETVVKRAIYESELHCCWRTVQLSTSPPKEIAVPPQKDPREIYLEELFYPGRFSTQALCKALELYGVSDLKEQDVTQQRLMALISLQVEQELQATAGSMELHHDEYRELNLKCWAKFYGCCYQYHQLHSAPLALSQDPGTGMGLMVKTGTVSFLWPDCLSNCFFNGQELEASQPNKEVIVFLECVRETVSQLNADVLESFLLELMENRNRGQSPQSMAMEVAAALHEGGCIEAINAKLSSIGDLSVVLQSLLDGLDPAHHSSMDHTHDVDPEYQTAMSQLFASRVSSVLLGSAFQGVCHTRMCLCRDIVVMLCALENSTSIHVATRRFIPQFSCLLLSYHTLHWFSTRTPLPTTTSPFDANVRQLAALELSTTRVAKSSLVELYLSSQGHQELIHELTRQNVFSSSPFHSYWTTLMPAMVHMLIAQLWPMTSSCHVCEFLLAESQYTHVKDFLSLVKVYVSSPYYSHLYLLGQAFLGMGSLSMAFNCFSQAAVGIGNPSEPLLESVVSAGVEEGGCDGVEEGGSSGQDGTVSYYVKVMRLFEQVSSPVYVIKVAELAISVTDKKDPSSVILWSNLFKYHLDLGHSREAYEAMIGNPDPVRRKDCLRRLVVVLTEQQQMRDLCQFTYTGMEDEIEKVIEDRARSVDVMKHSYYELLYCFYTCRGNYRKAAHVMYEWGLRVGREIPGVKSLQKQANCYCMALTTLGVTDPMYVWVVRPVELVQQSAVSKGRKRVHSVQKGLAKKQVEVLTMEDIEKEYLLVCAKLSLIQRDPTLATQLSSPFVSADEVSTLMVQAGLFDSAIRIANKFKTVSMETIFEALAARCVHLSVNMMTFRQSTGDISTWDWVDLNETATSVTLARENSFADKAWALLRSLLETHDPAHGHVLQGCVARKLLSLGGHLPQWLVETYKRTNPAELVRIYLTFDLLEAAVCLAMEYIDAVMGHGKKEFGMKTALHAHFPSVWLPYSVLDHLKQALKKVPPDSPLKMLSENFDAKLEEYFRTVKAVSMEMEELARERQSKLNSMNSLVYT